MNKPRLVAAALCLLVGASWLMSSGDNAAGKGKPSGGSGGSTGPFYQIIELDNSGGMLESIPEHINNAGLIVGSVYSPDFDTSVAAYWTLSGSPQTTTLHMLNDGGATNYSIAWGVNDDGEIVGACDNRAVYWPNSDVSAPMVLPAPTGSASTMAHAINKNGVICGIALGEPDSDGNVACAAVVWRVSLELIDGQPTPKIWGPLVLPALGANDLNYAESLNDNDGGATARVVGWSESDTRTAVGWTVVSKADGSLTAAGPVVLDEGADAASINNFNTACGRYFPDPTVWHDAVVWSGSSRTILDKSATYTGSIGRQSILAAAAVEINWGNTIIGYGIGTNGRQKAAVWNGPDSPMVLLDDYIRKTAFSQLNWALSINDSGRIVGIGRDDSRGIRLGFLAIPK